jgi:hypothetical protein
MTFKLPGGDLKWLVCLWLLAGVGGAIYGLVTGVYVLAAMALVVAGLAMGICYQIRACAWILLVMLCLQSVSIIIRDVILAEKFYRLTKLVLNVWFIHLLYKWLRDAQEEPS